MQDHFCASVAISCGGCTLPVFLTCSINAQWSPCMKYSPQFISVVTFSCDNLSFILKETKYCSWINYSNGRKPSFTWTVGTISCCSGNSIACCFWTSPLHTSWEKLWYMASFQILFTGLSFISFMYSSMQIIPNGNNLD